MSGKPSDTLARTFIDLLRRDAAQDHGTPPMPGDDGLDDLLGASAKPEAPTPTPPALRPDLVAVAVMLARAIEPVEGLLRAFRRGNPVVAAEVPAPDWVEPTESVVRICALGPACVIRNGDTSRGGYGVVGSREALVFARDGSATSHRSDKGNDVVGDAIQAGHAVIGIAPDAGRMLPRDLTRAAEHRLTVPTLDPGAVALVIEAVVGSPPSRDLDAALAATCDVSDLRLAVHASRGADGSLDRLEAVLRPKRPDPGHGPGLEDLHGYGEARAWGLSLVEDLKRWKAGEIEFRDLSSALLLSGPPGCGKTQFALALARSAGLPLLAGSLGQWQSARDGHLGHTLGAMRKFFESARREPCIALIDEIDSFGDRATFPEDHRSYSVQVVNALLEHLDGAVAREGVIVIGATNFPERLDPAIRRSGRLDRHIRIGLPDRNDLVGILRHYLGGDLPDADLTPIAVRARGMTGADIEAFVRTARGYARQRAATALTVPDLLAAVDAGQPPIGDATRLRIAVHEAGHGLASVVGGSAEAVALSIHSAGGTTETMMNLTSGSGTEADFGGILLMLLAGRAAEEVLLGEVSAGAAGDLAGATRFAAMMETRWGFSRERPLVSIGTGDDVDILRMPWILNPVQERLSAAYEGALDLMRTERKALERLSEALFEKGFLEDAEVRAHVVGTPPRARTNRKPARRTDRSRATSR
jgi:ATP-dependent Zn protease